MGLPEQATELHTWVSIVTNTVLPTLLLNPQSPSGHSGVSVLIQKIHMCISQLEQLPVRANEVPGRR